MIALILVSVLVPGATREPVRLSIDAPDKILRPGTRMPVRFTIENAGDASANLEEPENYLDGLEVLDAEGRQVRAPAKTRPVKRAVAVEPGGFVGRTVDVAAALTVTVDQEGWHTLRWLNGDLRSNELRVLVVRDWVATIATNHGDIAIEFLPQGAPNHVIQFVRLSRSGFYDGSRFHRIIAGFMMQGGRPADAKNELKAALKAEFSSVKHIFGTVSMARTSDPDSATSQFFICFAPAPHLDTQYSVFGRVVSGEEVVKEVEKVKTDHTPCRSCGQPLPPKMTPHCGAHHEDKPETEVIIKKITLSERKR